MAGTYRKTPQYCGDCPVRQNALFRPISLEHIQTVAKHRLGQREVPASTHLYRQGEDAAEAFTLFDGWVMLYRAVSDGRRQIVRFALPGDFLRFQPDLYGPVNHSAQTLTPATLCVFPRQNLLEMFRQNPELAMQMAWITSRDETIAHEHITSLGRRSARERIALLFLELHHRLTSRGLADDPPGLALPLKQEHIADAVGITTIHANRTLRSLREDALAVFSGGRLQLLDRPALVELTGFHPDTFTPRPLL